MKITTTKVFFLSLFLIVLCLFVSIFTNNVGSNIVFADTATSSLIVTLEVNAGIAISSPSDVVMSRALSMTADTAVGSSTWNVQTNNYAGYSLTLKASTTPAMQSASSSIADYQTGSQALWSVSSGDARFGFSAYGTDITPGGTWGSGTDCQNGGHIPSNSLKYLGFTTSGASVVARSATTTYDGSDTTVCYAVEQNHFYIASGIYTATITATAVTL